MRVFPALDKAHVGMLAPPVWVVGNVQDLPCRQGLVCKVKRVKIKLDVLHDFCHVCTCRCLFLISSAATHKLTSLFLLGKQIYPTLLTPLLGWSKVEESKPS
jgi:hypothetical protein